MKEIQIVIIEDEAVTARNLAYLLQNMDARIRIAGILESVQEAVEWFNDNALSYHLIFSDIKLTDGLSFEIFQKTTVNAPVIFVTAYDNHAMEAFKNNGIDYILKPFDEQELRTAITKFDQLTAPGKTEATLPNISELLGLMQQSAKTYRKSFLIPVESRTIAWFHTEKDLVYAHTIDNQKYIIEETLEELEQQLAPELFFRANRQYIVNRKAIFEVEHYFNGRLLIHSTPATPDNILVSKARAPVFKNWLNS
jgi:two-component system, LytTR family, response regulator LytT